MGPRHNANTFKEPGKGVSLSGGSPAPAGLGHCPNERRASDDEAPVLVPPDVEGSTVWTRPSTLAGSASGCEHLMKTKPLDTERGDDNTGTPKTSDVTLRTGSSRVRMPLLKRTQAIMVVLSTAAAILAVGGLWLYAGLVWGTSVLLLAILGRFFLRALRGDPATAQALKSGAYLTSSSRTIARVAISGVVMLILLAVFLVIMVIIAKK